MTKVLSFGHRCSSASLIKYGLNLKTESHPFDWSVSKLRTIRHCLETDFVEFLKSENYVLQEMETCTVIDGKKTHIRYEPMFVNTVYETDMTNTSTFHSQLAMNHKTIQSDYDYFVRCIDRLHNVLASEGRKVYVYIHPIQGETTYDPVPLCKEYDDFNRFIVTKSTNIFGIFFVIVASKDWATKTSVKLEESPTHVVYTVYCSENMLDVGTPFEGESSIEVFDHLCLLLRIHIYTVYGTFL